LRWPSLAERVHQAHNHSLFSIVLKKFFTDRRGYENNRATSREIAMKAAVKTLLTHSPRGAVEDTVGLLALFVLLFAVLAVPGLA
jgi:hypothetical protein